MTTRRNFLRNLAGGLALAMLPFVRELPPCSIDAQILETSKRIIREGISQWFLHRYGVAV